MPQFNHYTTIKVVLPSTKNLPEEQQAWVEMRTDILVGDLISPTKEQETSALLQNIGTVSRMIVAWNFTKEDGSIEDITEENVRRIIATDFNVLTESLTTNVISDEEKKSSSSTSQPAKTETPTA